MRVSTSASRVLCVCAAITIVAGCSSGGSQLGPAGPMDQQSAARFGMGEPRSTAVASAVHDADRIAPDRIIYRPASVTKNNLYVSNSANSTVTVYSPGSTSVLRRIYGLGGCGSLAFDGFGNLYVASGHNSVTVYAPGSDRVLRTISKGVRDPCALAFDGFGNLYVANLQYPYSSVTVYARGSTSLLRTISHGVSEPVALAFDGSGNLYVANYRGNTITVYAPGSTSVLMKISQGIAGPRALAFGP